MKKQNKNRIEAETVCKHRNKVRKEGRINGRKERRSKEGKEREKVANMKELWRDGMNNKTGKAHLCL